MVPPSLKEDHVNNHLFIGDQPPTTVNSLLCQVKAIPHKSEGIKPFTMVNTPPCLVRAIPCKSEGIEPFSKVNTLLCQVHMLQSIFYAISVFPYAPKWHIYRTSQSRPRYM